MPTAILHDQSPIEVEVHGEGPTLLLPVNPTPIEGSQAELMRQWGTDPALGRSLIDGLQDVLRVVAFDYEGHVLTNPKPDTLTPANIVGDFLAIADAVRADTFAFYGYSWLALGGLQLAIRTARLSALAMGGFPPIDGPYDEMLRVTTATHEMAVDAQSKPAAPTPAEVDPADPIPTADVSPDEFDWSTVEVTMSETQTRQFMTLYQSLMGFDDRAAQARITCPRLCFAGSADEIEYGERWDNVRVSMVKPLLERHAELEALGWDVRVLDGLDHTQAMQAANVLPVIRPWLATALSVD